MSPAHLVRVVRAELVKVFTRPLGFLNLIVALLVGVLVALFVNRLDHADSVTVMDQSLGDMFNPTALDAAGWALWARHFFLQPLFLILATTTAIASEHADRTLREVLVRPVPRWAVLLSRLLAMSLVSAATLLLTLLGSFAVGVPLFGMPEAAAAVGPTLGGLLLAYVVSILADLALISWTATWSLFVRSAGMVVVGLSVLLLLDAGLTALLRAGAAVGVASAQTALPWTLYSAGHAWQGYETGWSAEGLLLLVVYLGLGLGLAFWKFQKLDAP